MCTESASDNIVIYIYIVYCDRIVSTSVIPTATLWSCITVIWQCHVVLLNFWFFVYGCFRFGPDTLVHSSSFSHLGVRGIVRIFPNNLTL